MSTRSRIIEAAIETFAERGKYGARMEQIAKRAGINKAMLYYYYTSKENLYREVLKTILAGNFNRIFSLLREGTSTLPGFVERIRRLSSTYHHTFSEQPSHTRILTEALAGDPRILRDLIRHMKSESNLIQPERLLQLFEEGMEQGAYRDIDPRQILISLIGMNLIYFLARPVANILLEMSGEDEASLRRDREESVIDLFLHGILSEQARRTETSADRERR